MLQEHLEKLISTGYRLIALETDSPGQTIHDFRPLVREGKAIYIWEENNGLSRMEASHISIPHTKTPKMVLDYIKQSPLYGIYLLVGFNNDLANPELVDTLGHIANEDNANKTIILVDSIFNYPNKILENLLIAQELSVRERTLFEHIA